MPTSIRPVKLGFISYVVVIATALVPYFWPPELNLIFNKVFWSGVFLLAQCGLVIGYLYRTRGGSGRHVRFTFWLLLILAAALMFSSFEQVAKNAEVWQPRFSWSYSGFFILLKQLLAYVKDIVAFGFAALGSNIAASTITES
jgi:hypothetical protein